jgi:hypothetical protein
MAHQRGESRVENATILSHKVNWYSMQLSIR